MVVDPTLSAAFLIASLLCALLSSVSAWVAVRLAVRNSRDSSAFASLLLRLSALEAQAEKTLEMQRRLAVRVNLAEGKAAEAATGRPTSKAPKEPDWKTDPAGWLARRGWSGPVKLEGMQQ
jgi:hypothetical protein